MKRTLLGHLSSQFPKPENVATEGLCFILRSPIASRAFADLVKGTGIALPESLSYETQSADAEGAKPDMKGVDTEGRVRIVVESKFWAGLTENQPCTYIRDLPGGESGIVLFIVPGARVHAIWELLKRACIDGAITLANEEPERFVASVGEGHRLAVVSWKSVLTVIQSALLAAGELGAANDAAQLYGLCEAQDSASFLPLRSDELTNREIPERFRNYVDLAKAICAASAAYFVAGKWASGDTYTGTTIKMSGFNFWFGFSVQYWRAFEAGPVWVQSASQHHQVRDRLRTWLTSSPRRAFIDDGSIYMKDAVAIPIRLPMGVERDEVIREGVRQVAELYGMLASAKAEGAAAV